MLPWLGDPVIQRLDQKIEELTGMGPHFAEGIQVSLRRLRWGPLTELHAFVRSACLPPQVARYETGQQYKPHLDNHEGT